VYDARERLQHFVEVQIVAQRGVEHGHIAVAARVEAELAEYSYCLRKSCGNLLDGHGDIDRFERLHCYLSPA
jgi:hypothetical protein